MERNPYIERKSFQKTKFVPPFEDLIEVQKKSFDDFLQLRHLPKERKSIGIQSAFEKVFPINNFKETSALEFIDYSIGKWSCQCGKTQGVENSRLRCRKCGHYLPIEFEEGLNAETACPTCGVKGEFERPVCDKCGTAVELKLAYSPYECLDKGHSYTIPLYVSLRLIVGGNEADGSQKEIREQGDIFFGEIPYMTDMGTFIINGTERLVVNQLHQAPGVMFHREKKSKEGGDQTGNELKAVIMAHRGAKLEFVVDKKRMLFARINEKKKIAITTFLRALKLETDAEILRKFYKTFTVKSDGGMLLWQFGPNLSPGDKKNIDAKVGRVVDQDVLDPETGDLVLKRGSRLTKTAYKKIEKMGLKYLAMDREELNGAALVEKIEGIDGAVGEPLDPAKLDLLIARGDEFEVFFPQKDDIKDYIVNTLAKDVTIKTSEDACNYIFTQLRPGEPFHADQARLYFHNLFFNAKRYDLSTVGRYKLNLKLELNEPLTLTTLTTNDIIETIKYYLCLLENKGGVEDDRDHLGNRRVRAVGELVTDQFISGLQRLEKMIKEKLIATQELQAVFPKDLINSKPITASLKEFFGTSELSQFLDQTNPLAEITHKRRVSALGPGGLKRERAGFEVRDVHNSHYGRICPIETPEGQNIGLIVSLSSFAKTNEFGFLVTPYRQVKDGVVKDFYKILAQGDSRFKIGDIVEESELVEELKILKETEKKLPTFQYHLFYLTPWEEERHTIAQANTEVDENGNIVSEIVSGRKNGEFSDVPREDVKYIDISPKQLVSIAAALIPFLENDDANRALMGSNMQRQAVSLVRPDSPVVGTGVEAIAGRGCGTVVVARRPGVVEKVDAERIIVKVEDEGEEKVGNVSIGADLYNLLKYRRSNQDTVVTQRPIVKKGDRVEAGQVIADDACTDKGELALGQNLLVGFVPWRGYNYEDAILISRRLVEEDNLTSLHVVEESTEVRDTKLGHEEITRDLPLKGEKQSEKLKDLDESGVIRIGAEVKPGDILVGKIAPKPTTQLTPEEKLLKAIFGHKAMEIKDASLRCPPGKEGRVVDVKIFTRRGIEKDERAKQIDELEIERLKKNLHEETEVINIEAKKKMRPYILGRVLAKDVKTETYALKKGETVKAKVYDKQPLEEINKWKFEPDTLKDSLIEDVKKKAKVQVEALKVAVNEKIDTLRKGDDLPPGVLKIVKVFIVMKRKIQEGDKLAGRHGNKGVISRIVPPEDMPFLPDGRPLDVVLNPLGVPSRMNVGQILETHLGWAAQTLGLKIATPVFDGANEEDVRRELSLAGLPEDGKTVIYDGMTGEPFDQRATVGCMYMMKLIHMAEDKVHARSTGPYSLITQQPLGGKAQFGGQRFGEMEVWALEAYGAAYALQEMLTAKSDDVEGRNRIYESIVKGTMDYSPSLPEAFNVLIRELMSLAINVELLKKSSGQRYIQGEQPEMDENVSIEVE